MNISARILNASMFPCPSLTSGIAGAVLCSAYIKHCAACHVASMEDICGIFFCFGKNSTVYDIISALVLGMYALWNLESYIADPM